MGALAPTGSLRGKSRGATGPSAPPFVPDRGGVVTRRRPGQVLGRAARLAPRAAGKGASPSPSRGPRLAVRPSFSLRFCGEAALRTQTRPAPSWAASPWQRQGCSLGRSCWGLKGSSSRRAQAKEDWGLGSPSVMSPPKGHIHRGRDSS